MNKTDVTKTVVKFANETTFQDLPSSVIAKVKQIILDSIGCALGSYVVDRSRIALELVGELGGKPQASIIGSGRTSYALAAFANGELINALDYDANGPLTPHVIPYVMPPSLAIAERVSASGKELITALAIGHEIGGRVAGSLAQHRILIDEPPYYEWSPRFGFTSTIFGAVAGAGRLLKLTDEQMSNAFGIAGASTPVPANAKWEHTPGPAIMTKYNCWSGWIAQLATFAALLAEKGFTGDRTILDGDWGFWKIYGSPFFKVENLVSKLGELWHVDEAMHIKGAPVCKLNQSTVDGVNKLILDHNINPDDIESIVIKSDPTLLTPNRSQTEITSFADTQFCSTFIAALAAYHGRQPGPMWQLPVTFKDAKLTELTKKVTIEIHPDAPARNMEQAKGGKLQGYFGATVEMIAAGKKYVVDIEDAKGSPSNPMTEKEIMSKFRNNVAYSPLKNEKIERIVDCVNDLEKIDDIDQFMMLLRICD